MPRDQQKKKNANVETSLRKRTLIVLLIGPCIMTSTLSIQLDGWEVSHQMCLSSIQHFGWEDEKFQDLKDWKVRGYSLCLFCCKFFLKKTFSTFYSVFCCCKTLVKHENILF